MRRLLILTLPLACLAAADPADDLTRLAAQADADRAALAAVSQRWADEAAGLSILDQALADQERALAARIAALEQRLASERAAQAAQREHQAQTTALLAAAGDLATRLASGLEAQLQDSLLAEHDLPVGATAALDAAAQLDQAVAALVAAEAAARRIERRTTVGLLPDGRPQAVDLLLVGGVAAWWRSIDGSSVGRASRVDGQLHLQQASDPAAVQRLFAVAEGRQAPTLLAMPVAEGAP